MKTTCFALLAIVSVASSMPTSSGIRAPLPAEELREPPRIMMHPEEPASHVFPKDSTILFFPMCPGSGYYRDPFNCAKFYECSGHNAVPYGFYCPTGLIFNMETNECEFGDC